MRHYKEVIRVERTITKVKSGLPKQLKRKRVAAYTRVSTAKDAMLHSLSAQVSYFSDLIQRNPEWEYVGVYSDEGISGTKENRAALQQMLDDCRAGKVDMIITKSLSRFARNTVARDTMLTRFCIIASFNGDRPCFRIYEKADIGWVVQDLQGALVNADSIARKVQ